MRNLVLITAVLAFSGAALAAPTAPRPKIDANGDGVVSREEARGHPHIERDFDQIDTNGDGRISRDEKEAWGKKQHAKAQRKATAKFKDADRDGNAMLSREEAQSIPRIAKNFDAMDANRDGQVSKDEARRYSRPEREAGRAATQRP